MKLIIEHNRYQQYLVHLLTSNLSCPKNNPNISKHITNFNIILGGNYGQGKLKVMWKLITRDVDEINMNYYVITMVHIDCEKDKYMMFFNHRSFNQ